jgi:phosphoglucosamine mutase
VIRGSIPGVITDLERLIQKLKKQLKPASVNDLDGFKLIFEDGWLLIRPSGTEPKIRVTAEAESESRARMYYEKALDMLKSAIK